MGSEAGAARKGRVLAAGAGAQRAERALAIDEQTAAELAREGFGRDEAGRDLVPEKHVYWVSAERADQIRSAHALEIRLDRGVLGTTHIALVPFASWSDLVSRRTPTAPG